MHIAFIPLFICQHTLHRLERKNMNTFRRIESLYRENGYKTHYAEKKHNRILLLYPNTKKSKIYAILSAAEDGAGNAGRG